MATKQFADNLIAEERDRRFDEQIQVINTINAIFAGNLWIKERDKRGTDELHKALDRIMSCPYDDLKTTISTILDALIALRSERDVQAAIDAES